MMKFIALLSFLFIVCISVCSAEDALPGEGADTEISLENYHQDSPTSVLKEALQHCYSERIHGMSQHQSVSQQEKRQSLEWRIADWLWQKVPTQQTAREIVQLARASSESHQYQLFTIIDTSFRRQLLTEEERFSYLLKYKLMIRVGRPEALDIRLSPQHEGEHLFPDADDRQFVERHRQKAIHYMRQQLREHGTAAAALLLGYFNDRASLPLLEQLFIESDGFYGWESTLPDILNYAQFPEHHCYEEAIEHITGKTLEQHISLTEANIFQLRTRYRQGSETALYVLYRLVPKLAFQEASKAFKVRVSENRLPLCVLMQRYFLQKGLLTDEIQGILGQPNLREEDMWEYHCGPALIDDNAFLTISFEEEMMMDAAVDVRLK